MTPKTLEEICDMARRGYQEPAMYLTLITLLQQHGHKLTKEEMPGTFLGLLILAKKRGLP